MGLSHGKPVDIAGFGIGPEDLPAVEPGRVQHLDLRGWFGPERRDLPLELEIGSGKGTFLLQQAGSPEGLGVNYIGVEWARQFWLYAADRMRRHGRINVRVVRADAGAFVRQYVPDGCLRQVHIYFPDPWPKARQQKRRLVGEPFLRELWRVLEQSPACPSEAWAGAPIQQAISGTVRIATDHAGYFQWMEEHAAKVDDLFERLGFESPASAGEGELVGTNFERKYRREGRPFYGMVLRKRAGTLRP